MNKNKLWSGITAATLTGLILTGCSDSDDPDSGEFNPGGDDNGNNMEVTRAQDSREFEPATEISLDAGVTETDSTVFSGTYEGIQGQAVYAAEIPDNWNGGMVMYTHGFRGDTRTLNISKPGPAYRSAVVGEGYAWAASSYSANFYDVRAGIEDTNKLALEIMDFIEADFGQRFQSPDQVLISGFSMGGHTAAAAVERENMERTAFPVDYEGALPFCQAGQYEFQWLGDYNRLVRRLSGFSNEPYEFERFQELLPSMLQNLFQTDSTGNITFEPANSNGERLKEIAIELTGGDRPIFDEFGFSNAGLQAAVLGTGGRSGGIDGILARNEYDNTSREYRWTDGDQMTVDEQNFNDAFVRVSADEGVNPVRDDGVRWLPLVEGDFDVPVMTMHTLGDFFVPFRHQQLYRERAITNEAEDMLVQRAIRDPGHCGFTASEISTALVDWLNWVNGGDKPDGDVVLEPEVVADSEYGCDHTINDSSRDRSALPQCSTTGN